MGVEDKRIDIIAGPYGSLGDFVSELKQTPLPPHIQIGNGDIFVYGFEMLFDNPYGITLWVMGVADPDNPGEGMIVSALHLHDDPPCSFFGDESLGYPVQGFCRINSVEHLISELEELVASVNAPDYVFAPAD